jgi:VWFA-related protein
MSGYSSFDRGISGHRTVDALAAIADALGVSRDGPKAIVLFSEGLHLTDATEGRLHAFVDAARRARVAVYAVDVKGLRTEDQILTLGQELGRVSVDSDGNMRPGAGGALDANEIRLRARSTANGVLSFVATNTGGALVADTNALSRIFSNVDSDLASFYELAYVSDNQHHDGSYRTVSVATKRRGTTVWARPGYYALREESSGKR